jgi:TonB-dependent receptor
MPGHKNGINGYGNDRVKEEIWAGYGQITWKGQIAGHDTSLVAGARYERTTVHSTAIVAVPTDIRWQSDNDFTADLDFSNQQSFAGNGKYNNLLPSMDFQINLKQNLIGRFSFSRTLARPNYNNLFVSASAGNPNDATAVGGQTGGQQGNPNLKPLLSDNFDLSLEWYFKPDSYLSAGFFDKRVHNFIGNSVVKKPLFGLRDPSSGLSGRSGTAKTQLQAIGADVTDVNLFTYTALLVQNGGNTSAATNTFLANYDASKRALVQSFVDSTLNAVDIIADENDPLFQFNVSTPINNKDARIWGFELAGQYFLGRTGFGIAAQYTHVRGNIGIDVTAPIDEDQFALLGLSDTANATLIYDKNGISARLSYNWRDKFLSAANADSYHSPRFTKAHSQVDFNVSYDITPRLAASVEGINIFESGLKVYGRSTNEMFFMQEGSARYLVGLRYKF